MWNLGKQITLKLSIFAEMIFCLDRYLLHLSSVLVSRPLKKKWSHGATSKTHARSSMFIAALLKTARTQKQPKCPLTEEWVKKMGYMYTVEYYSAIKVVSLIRNHADSLLLYKAG